MKKNKKSVLLLLLIMFGAKVVPAQAFEVNPKLLVGLGYSFQPSLKYGGRHVEYGFYFLRFFKEKAFFSQLNFGSIFFAQGKRSNRFAAATNFILTGGVRLPGFGKVSLYLNGGGGVVFSSGRDYTGVAYQGGIKLLQAMPFCGVIEVNLNFVRYNFYKDTEETGALGIVYWMPVPKKRKWHE